MSHLIVETSEGVALRIAVAGAGSRLCAGIVDVLILVSALLIGLIVLGVISIVDPAGVTSFLQGLLVVGSLLLTLVYHVAFHAWNGGQTPGKRAAGIRVVSTDGQPPTAVALIVRTLVWPIDVLLWIPIPIGLLIIALTERHQRLGDLVAGTMVVHVDATQRPTEPFAAETWSALPVKALALTSGTAARLSPRDRAFLRSLWTRSSLLPDQRRQLFVTAAKHYSAKLGLGPFDDARVVLKELYLFAREHARVD